MKKNILTIILSVLLAGLFGFVGCSPRNDQQAMLRRLEQLDALINKQPSMVLDSLNTIESDPLSAANEAYYNLLLTIAMDKSYKDFASDSLIASSARWFSRHSDYHNYARALFYEGIVRYRINASRTDTLTFSKFKGAETICLKHAIDNPSLQKFIYFYLGDFLYSNADFDESKKYYNLSATCCIQDKDYSTLLCCNTQLCWLSIVLNDTMNAHFYVNKADSILLSLDSPNSKEAFLVLNAKSILAEEEGRYLDAIDYERQMDKLVKEPASKRAKTYYVYAYLFDKAGLVDSAWHYSGKCIASIVDTLNLSNQSYYSLYAKLATLTHHFPQAVTGYQKALEAAEHKNEIQTEKKILTLEKRFNLAQKETEIAKSERKNILLLLCLIVVCTIVLFLIYFSYKNQEQKRKDAIIVDLLRAHLGEVGSLAKMLGNNLPSQKTFTKMEVISYIDNVTSASKQSILKRMIDIANGTYSEYESDASLSKKENLMQLLFSFGLSIKDQARFLNVSEDNIRSSQSRIKKKHSKRTPDTSPEESPDASLDASIHEYPLPD